SGVANALKTGAMVVQAQRNGSAIPENLGEGTEPAPEGDTATFPLRAVLDFLNNSTISGRPTLDARKARPPFALPGAHAPADASRLSRPLHWGPTFWTPTCPESCRTSGHSWRSPSSISTIRNSRG